MNSMHTLRMLTRAGFLCLVGSALLLSGCCGGGDDAKNDAPVKESKKKKKKDKKKKKKEKESADLKKCPASFKLLKDYKSVDKLSCKCKDSQFTGSVWGNKIYTLDSSICNAALHAGVIGKDGGKVKLKKTEGCKTYIGTKENGVSSSNWGSYAGSFYFPDAGDGECPKSGTCPRRFKDMEGYSKTEKNKLDCTCDSAQFSGSVWGTDMYTSDSSVCNSALHAGAITKEGGKIKARSTNGCKKYAGAEKNGVKSSSWGSYELSFYFPDTTGKPECAE